MNYYEYLYIECTMSLWIFTFSYESAMNYCFWSWMCYEYLFHEMLWILFLENTMFFLTTMSIWISLVNMNLLWTYIICNMLWSMHFFPHYCRFHLSHHLQFHWSSSQYLSKLWRSSCSVNISIRCFDLYTHIISSPNS